MDLGAIDTQTIAGIVLVILGVIVAATVAKLFVKLAFLAIAAVGLYLWFAG